MPYTHSNTDQDTSPISARSALTTREAAAYLRLSTSTLNKWRCHGGGPEFLKLGRAIRYRREDLDAFLAARRLSSTAAY